MELTNDERAIVEDYRKHKAAEEIRKRQSLHIIQTAGSFLQWILESGRGASFNTFTEEYGYQGDFGRWSPGAFYERVVELIELAEK